MLCSGGTSRRLAEDELGEEEAEEAEVEEEVAGARAEGSRKYRILSPDERK
jgi:hypothetical protein